MSVPKYRLQPVLDSKEKKKQDAEKLLADARSELARQQDILKQREQDVARAMEKKEMFSSDFMKKMEGGMDTSKIAQGKAYLEVLKQNIVTAKKRVEEQAKVVQGCEQKVQNAVLKLTEATKEMKVIEKHKENWAEAVKKDVEFKEEKEQEEIAQNLYEQFRRKKGR